MHSISHMWICQHLEIRVIWLQVHGTFESWLEHVRPRFLDDQYPGPQIPGIIIWLVVFELGMMILIHYFKTYRSNICIYIHIRTHELI